MHLHIPFLPKNIFFVVLKRDKLKKWGDSGEKGRMYMKGWFKPISLIFLT